MSEAKPAVEGYPFPLESYKEAAKHLRRPFTPEAIKFKVQATREKGALVVGYIDARLVVERLNMVVPHLWTDDYEATPGGKGLLCRLTVDGITRLDVGSDYSGKGLYSDALKRAAVKFGVGVSLYALPKIILNFSDGHVEKKGKNVVVTPNGETRCRNIYESWLDTIGEEKFGDPLDHGDVTDALGDVDAEAEAGAVVAVEEEPQPEKLTDAKAKALIEGAEKLYKELPKAAKKGLTPAAFNRQLASTWHSHEELEKLIASLERLGAANA